LLEGPEQSVQLSPPADTVVVVAPDGTAVSTTDVVETTAEKKPAARKRGRATSRKATKTVSTEEKRLAGKTKPVSDKAVENDVVEAVAKEKPKQVRKPRKKAAAKTGDTTTKAKTSAVKAEDIAVKTKIIDLYKVDKSVDDAPVKKGWWRRGGG